MIYVTIAIRKSCEKDTLDLCKRFGAKSGDRIYDQAKWLRRHPCAMSCC